MKMPILVSAGVLVVGSAAFTFQANDLPPAQPVVGAAPAVVELVADPTLAAPAARMWQRPEGPIRIALQAGHWQSAEAPDEQAGLRNNGTRGGGKAEWEVNLDIARRTAELLEAAGYQVDVLPTTIPPGYWADVFLSIHADGNTSSSTSGFRASAPRRDATGRSTELVALLEESYREATGLRHYPTVTRRMQNYYAFNYRRYLHALHPLTVAAILETGFLTSAADRRVIVDAPDRAARGIAEGVQRYLAAAGTLPPQPLPVYEFDPRPRNRRRD